MSNTHNHPPRTFKDTFWCKQRVAKNLYTKEVAEMLGFEMSTVSQWFSGQHMPKDKHIRSICKLFDVDYNEGQLAFQKAHLEWKSEHDKRKTKFMNKDQKAPKEEEVALSSADKINNVAEVILALYSKISCEAFLTVYNAITSGKPEDCDIERIIYQKVDFDTYKQIIAIMKS